MFYKQVTCTSKLRTLLTLYIYLNIQLNYFLEYFIDIKILD